MKVQKGRYFKARPKIEQDDLEGGDFVVVTVVGFEEVKQDGDKGEPERITPMLLTEEFGDKVLWLNATQIGFLTQKLGEETDRWIDKRVPLVKHTSRYGGEEYPKVWVAAPEEWDDLLAQAEPGASNRRVRKPAKATKRRGR